MTTTHVALAAILYLVGLLALRAQRSRLIGYLWSAFGLAALLFMLGILGEWNLPLGALQASALTAVAGVFGVKLAALGPATLIVPDPTGWSVLGIGVECSTLIEGSVFLGLMLFYPRFPAGERLLRIGIGLAATVLVNLVRLGVIVLIVTTLGKPAVPWAHAVVARLVFFAGIVYVYWRMMTLPTLTMIRRDLEVSGRSVL